MVLNGLKSVATIAVVSAVICHLVAFGHSLNIDEDFTTPPSNILLITMGGTRSHKIPFMAMAKGLIAKGHRVTLLSGYPASEQVEGLEEVVPEKFRQLLVSVEDYDYLGTRIRNEFLTNIMDAIKLASSFCIGVITDPLTKELLTRKFDLIVIDSYYPECALGLVPILKAPFIYLNTMTNFLNTVAFGGSPVPWSITPMFAMPFTNEMGFLKRIHNAIMHLVIEVIHRITSFNVHRIQRRHLHKDTPHPFVTAKNVSFILQNGHVSVAHPNPFLPNVVDIGGIHCHKAQPLPKQLNDYLDGAGEQGFIYVSMGTSVNPKTMPPAMLKTIVSAFSQLPYRILWKFEKDIGQLELPANVRIEKWLPQQDVLGHKNIKAFVTHSGMFSTLETVYHGVPVVTLPVFADQDSNAVKVVQEGFGIRLELKKLSVQQLVAAVNEVVLNPRYKAAAMRSQAILLDQPTSPLDTAVYWTEYVIRHKGAPHYANPAGNMNWIQLYSFDVVVFLVVVLGLLCKLLGMSRRYSIRIISGKEKGLARGGLKTKMV